MLQHRWTVLHWRMHCPFRLTESCCQRQAHWKAPLLRAVLWITQVTGALSVAVALPTGTLEGNHFWLLPLYHCIPAANF